MTTARTPIAPALGLSLMAIIVLVLIAAYMTEWAPNPEKLLVAVAFAIFGLLAQSGYASIYKMELSRETRMTHAVGFSLWMTAFILALWWFAGIADQAVVLVTMGAMALLAPVSFFTMKVEPNPDALVDRSSWSRGSPALDEWRWLLAVIVFAGALAFEFFSGGTMRPLFLAFWAIVASMFLAPTLDVEQPLWMLRLRDVATITAVVICAFAMDGVLI